MFKRIIYEEWANIVPLISFLLTFCVFLAITARAMLLREKTIDDLGKMPLEDESIRSKKGGAK